MILEVNFYFEHARGPNSWNVQALIKELHISAVLRLISHHKVAQYQHGRRANF